jgi:ATP-dependent helicase/nuclease subunit A
MAAYHGALEAIVPGARVEAALLYTAGPTLIVLTEGQIAAAKVRFAAAEQSLSVDG